MVNLTDLSAQPITQEQASQQTKGAIDLTDLGAQPISQDEFNYEKERPHYETPAMQAAAVAAGAARGLTFGVSDMLLRGVGLGEDAAKLQAYNPSLSTAGEAAGVIGGTFFGPAAALGAGTKAATAGIKSAIGRSVAREAIEGAAYGLGQTISEKALGSNESVAESLIANVGMASVLGAGFGAAGHGVLKGMEATSNQIKKFLKGDHAINKWVGETGDYFTSEFDSTPENINRIKDLAKEMGIPLTKGMESDSYLMRGLESSLSQRPTMFGEMVRKEVAPTYKAFQRETKKIVEDASELTINSIGDEIKNTIVQRAHELYDPTAALYKDIDASTKHIVIMPEARANMVKRLENAITERTTKGSEARSAFQFAIDSLSEDIEMPLNKLRQVISDLGDKSYMAAPKQKIIINNLKSSLDNYLDRQIRRAAIETAAKAPEGEAIAKELISDMKEAKRGWREFKTFLTDVSDEAGLGKKVRSMSDLLNAVENINAEKLGKNLFDPKSVKSLRFVQESFPEVFDKLRKLEVAKIRTASEALDPVGNVIVDINKLSKQLGKYSPEAAELIIGAEKIKTLDNLKVLANRMPRKIGPSGTPEGLAFANLLKTAMWAEDGLAFGIYKGSQLATDIADKQTKHIADKLGQFVTGASKPVVGLSTVGMTTAKRDYEERLNDLKEVALDPNKYVQRLNDNVGGLAKLDPMLHQAIANTSMQATQLLSKVAPKNPFEGDMVSGPVKWKPSDAELSKFNRYLKAIDDPFSLLNDLNNNLLTPESVQAIRQIYPTIYQQIIQKAVEQVGQHGQNIPYSKQVQLSMLLGQPINSAQDFKFIQRLQQGAMANTQTEQAKQAMPKQTKKISSDIHKGTMSQSEELIRSRAH